MRLAFLFVLLCTAVLDTAAQEWYTESLKVKALTVDTTYSLKHLEKELVYFNRLLEREPHLKDALYYKALILYRIYKADTSNSHRIEYILQAGRYIGSCLSGSESNEEYLALYLLIRIALLNEKIQILMWTGENPPEHYLSIGTKNPRLLISQACLLSYLHADPKLIREKLNPAIEYLKGKSNPPYPSWGIIEQRELQDLNK